MLTRPITPAAVYPVNRHANFNARSRVPGIIPGLGDLGDCGCGCNGASNGCGGSGLGDMEIMGIGVPALVLAGVAYWVLTARKKAASNRALKRILG